MKFILLGDGRAVDIGMKTRQALLTQAELFKFTMKTLDKLVELSIHGSTNQIFL